MEDAPKETKQPKKFVAFSAKDSQAIESAFQALDKGTDSVDEQNSKEPTSTRVPVNEDYLFDVHIEKRELEPAYWLGPVYEVRRGSWFFQESSILRPCDENLANQLEEGYLKFAPWRKAGLTSPRAVSQPRGRPRSAILEEVDKLSKDSDPHPDDSERSPRAATPDQSPTHRLFGTHMNTTVTYQDANTAYLISDDFMSRFSSTVYGRFGGMAGTKVLRGYMDPGQPIDLPARESKTKSLSGNASSDQDSGSEVRPAKARPTMLERQISSLAGMVNNENTPALDEEEEAREAEQKEMEASRDTDGEEQGRKIDHVILVTHGIGQRLGLRLDSINFVHDVNTLRKTMKGVYAASPDLQALTDSPKNCAVQVLPICWRHLLDFPQQSRRQNRKEQDLADPDGAQMDDTYPSLQDITVEGVPYVRALTSDLVLDVLLYQSAYREHIAKIVQNEVNRVLDLFKKRTGFSGTVSLCGHSLGSAVLFDILCRQGEEPKTSTTRHRMSSLTAREAGVKPQDLRLVFDCDNFFCLGSPIALFQMLKGRTITARPSRAPSMPLVSPFDPEAITVDPFSRDIPQEGEASSGVLSITTSSPKCGQLYNIFHPTDPIAYRIEPLISPAMASLKPQELPFTKKGLFAAPGLGNIYDRVGQQVISGWYNLTSGVASSLINRSLGVTGDERVLPQDKVRPGTQPPVSAPGTAQASLSIRDKLPIAVDQKKQQALADAAAAKTVLPSSTGDPPTLIDSEMDTLYAGFQKSLERRRASATSNENADAADTELQRALEDEKATRLKREEAKVKGLNSNGRVDYAIQEGMFDVSLLASIASHLSYWADEDVVHFMVGQVLKRGKKENGRGEGEGA